MRSPEQIGRLAAEALRVEARLTPKPGLVDAETNGAHADMDLALLLRSADALEPALIACAAAGAAERDPADLIALGLAGERAMLAATDGVNTHKGALFSLGLLAYCVGLESSAAAEADSDEQARRSAGTGEESGPVRISRICRQAAAIAGPWCNAWMAGMILREPVTHGELAYAHHGLLGARGEAATGFETVRSAGLWTLWRGRDAGRPDALLQALVALMAANPDTNLVARGGIEALDAVRAWSADAASLEPDALAAALRRADAEWSARRWSPGGSADLLAVTWFLDQAGGGRGAGVPLHGG